MSLFFGQPHPGEKDKHLREFLSHLFMECMIRYKNETIDESQTESSSSITPSNTAGNFHCIHKSIISFHYHSQKNQQLSLLLIEFNPKTNRFL